MSTASPTSAVSGVRVSVFKDLGSKFGTTFGARREALGAVRGGVGRGAGGVRLGRGRDAPRSADAARVAVASPLAGRRRCSGWPRALRGWYGGVAQPGAALPLLQ